MMKISLFILFICFIGLLSACDNELSNDYEPKEYIIPTSEYEKKLSGTPNGLVFIEDKDSNIQIDFECREYLKEYVTAETGEDILENIQTRGELIDCYKECKPVFEYDYSSITDYNHYIFVKLEYKLAQECYQEDCSSDTRRYILQMVIDKQPYKYEENRNAYITAQTGLFLIATILIKENDTAFINTIKGNSYIQDILTLTPNSYLSAKVYGDNMIEFAKNFLSNRLNH